MVAAHFLANQLEDGHHLTIFYKLTVNLLLAQNSFGSVDTPDIVALIPSCCGGSPFLPDEDCNPLRCCDRSPVLGLADQLADAGQEAGYTGLPMVTLGLPMVHSGPAGRTGHNSTIDDPHKQFLGSPSLSTH